MTATASRSPATVTGRCGCFAKPRERTAVVRDEEPHPLERLLVQFVPGRRPGQFVVSSVLVSDESSHKLDASHRGVVPLSRGPSFRTAGVPTRTIGVARTDVIHQLRSDLLVTQVRRGSGGGCAGRPCGPS